MSDTPVKKTILERVLDWGFQQGVSTILLLIIFGYAYQNIPKHLDTIQLGYEKISDKFEQQHEKTRAVYEESIKVMREEHRLDRESFRRALADGT